MKIKINIMMLSSIIALASVLFVASVKAQIISDLTLG